jgi:hypothetical protein
MLAEPRSNLHTKIYFLACLSKIIKFRACSCWLTYSTPSFTLQPYSRQRFYLFFYCISEDAYYDQTTPSKVPRRTFKKVLKATGNNDLRKVKIPAPERGPRGRMIAGRATRTDDRGMIAGRGLLR